MVKLSAPNISAPMLAWYDANRRDLPWRRAPGEPADAYRVWLSEIMLQQTTVATVRTYYGDFLARWPDVAGLAAAKLDDVLHAWQGLGYYSRARNLYRCAQAVVADHGGRFPDTEDGLRTLPGIGPYTAAAVAAIAFGRRATPVDGNIERVMARMFAIAEPLPGARKAIKVHAEALTPTDRAGDYAQALMDLGATVCKPRGPLCHDCPLMASCRAHDSGDPERFPVRPPRKKRPTRYGTVFWAERADGAVLVGRRPETGLLGGMMEFPSTPWTETPPGDVVRTDQAPLDGEWSPLAGIVVHIFTHFRLELRIVRALVAGAAGGNRAWCRPEDFGTLALPTVMKKVADLVGGVER